VTGILGSMNNRPLRIGLDARLVAYRAGGISSYIQQMVATLERIDPVHTYMIGESRKARVPLTRHFQRLALWTPPHHRLESLALSVELLPHRLDVWHATDFIPPYRGARRNVVSVHDLTFLVYPQFLTAASRRSSSRCRFMVPAMERTAAGPRPYFSIASRTACKMRG